MAPKTLLFALIASLLATLCLCEIASTPILASPVPDPDATTFHTTDDRLGLGLLICPCSFSGRGFRRGSEMLLKLGNATMGRSEQGREGTLHEGVLRTRYKAARAIFRRCASAFGIEACVNGEHALRTLMPLALCAHDMTTGKNVMFETNETVVTLGSCQLSPATRSPDRSLSRPGAGRNESGSEGAEGGGEDGVKNEGCVAVEHLRGAALQHRRHLRRKVLCARGFCATPNHAIEVGGRRTSMKEMCAGGGWRCVWSVKMVNNLKIAVNRRWRVSEDIVVTPYDRRFPVALCWVAQIAEDAWYIIACGMVVGGMLGSAAVLASVLGGGEEKR